MRTAQKHGEGFTLIEIMVVVAIIGVIVVTGIPTLYHLFKKEDMRKATSDVVEICSKARAQAILRGNPVEMVFYPRERRVGIGFSGGPGAGGATPEPAASSPAVGPAGVQSAVFPEDMTIEMLDINLSEYRESDWARVRFFPNGTSDEMTLVLRSSKNEWKKITLEVTTGLASVDNVVR